MVRSLLVMILVAVAPVSTAAQSRFSVGVLSGFVVEQPLNDYIPSNVQMGVAEVQFTGALITSDGQPVVEVLSAVFFGQSVRPGSRFTVGVSETFRVHIRPRAKFGAYFELGAGHVTTGMRIRELDGHYQSLLQGGAGLRWRSGRHTVTLGYRGIHLSNHGTTPPNHGLNVQGVVASYAFGL